MLVRRRIVQQIVGKSPFYDAGYSKIPSSSSDVLAARTLVNEMDNQAQEVVMKKLVLFLDDQIVNCNWLVLLQKLFKNRAILTINLCSSSDSENLSHEFYWS